MSNLENERLNAKLKKLLSDSLEINCFKLINWNLFNEQSSIMEKFFKDQFNKKESSHHEISKNLYKDLILRSNTSFPEQLWKDLKSTIVGKLFEDEIEKQFSIKKRFIKSTNETPQTPISSSPSISKSCTFPNKSTNLNTLKEELKQKLKSDELTTPDINTNTPDMNDDYDIDLSKQPTRQHTISHMQMSVFVNNFGKNLLNQEQETKHINNNNTIQLKCNERHKRKSILSSSLPNPKILNSDYYETNNEYILPDISRNTKLIIALSNTSNELIVKQMKTQAQIEINSFINETEKNGENIFYHSSTNKSIIYMTINLFLKKLITENLEQTNPLLVNGFITQHSAFISLDNLINKIISAYNFFKSSTPSNLSNLISFLSKLIHLEYPLTSSPSSFTPNKTFKTILSFYKDLSTSEFPKSFPSLNIKETYTSLKTLNKSSFLSQKQFSHKHKPKHHHPFLTSNGKYFYMFIYDSWDIACELTRITFSLFSKISSKELLRAQFSKNRKNETSPNIIKCIERFDQLIYFIIEDILAYDRQRCRAQLIEKWIDVAWECKEMGNFNDCLIINTAFCNYLLRNLKKSWEKVGSEYIQKLIEIKKICSFQNAYAAIKKETMERRKAGKLFIPYLGLLLKEISSLEEKYQYVKDDILVNWMKVEKVQIAIEEFFEFKKIKYNIKEREELRILEFLNPKMQEELEEEAMKLEPEFKYDKKDRYGKRQTRTDMFYYENKIEESESGLGMSKNILLSNYS